MYCWKIWSIWANPFNSIVVRILSHIKFHVVYVQDPGVWSAACFFMFWKYVKWLVRQGPLNVLCFSYVHTATFTCTVAHNGSQHHNLYLMRWPSTGPHWSRLSHHIPPRCHTTPHPSSSSLDYIQRVLIDWWSRTANEMRQRSASVHR